MLGIQKVICIIQSNNTLISFIISFQSYLYDSSLLFFFFATITSQLSAPYRTLDSIIARATDGIGIIQREGKESFRTIHTHRSKQDSGPINDGDVPRTGYDKFRAIWKDAIKDDIMVNYAKSKQPQEAMRNSTNSKIFSNEPSKDSYFLYDTAISLGLSMCYSPSDYLKGDEIFKNFTHDVQFEGASGMFQVNNETGSRDHKSLVSTLWNVRAVPDPTDDSFIVFDLVPTMNHMRHSLSHTESDTDPSWTRYIFNGYYDSRDDPQKLVLNDFIYSSGSIQPPVTYQLITNQQIGVTPRRIGQLFLIIIAILALSSVIWTLVHRKTKVVKVSHPLFLNVVTLGCLIMSFSVIPFMMDETVIINTKNIDMACMLSPWLINMGFALPLSAFSTKIWMSHKVSLPKRQFIFVSLFNSQCIFQ